MSHTVLISGATQKNNKHEKQCNFNHVIDWLNMIHVRIEREKFYPGAGL